MMKHKLMKLVIGFVVVGALLFAGTHLFGVFTIRSAVRVAYVGTEGWKKWTGRYTLLNGWMQRTLRPEAEMLHVDVKTESGALSIEMKNTEGAVIFSEENIGTSSFDVPVSGKTKIKITASNHKGSFDISERSFK